MARAQKGLLELADLVGRAVGDGAAMGDFRALGELVARNGGGAELVALLITEARKPSQSQARMVGFCVILTVVLDELRLSANGGSISAAEDLRLLRIMTSERMGAEEIGEGSRLMVARAYSDAGLDPPRALQEAISRDLDAASGLSATDPGDSLGERFFLGMARELRHDPYRVHKEMAVQLASLPAEKRPPVVAAMFSSMEACIREAGAGFLLDPDEGVAEAVGRFLSDLAPSRPVDSATVARLGRMRPWLSASRQVRLDQVLLACRRHSGPPGALPSAVCDRFAATPIDGAGAQSLFVVTRSSKKWALGSVLAKARSGVSDAWLGSGLMRVEVDDMLAEVRAEADGNKVSRAYFERRISHALRVNQASVPPPFALIQVLEEMGAGVIGPQTIDPAEMCEDLLAGLPPGQADEEALRRADTASPDWERRLSTISTWFEAGADIEAELRPLKSEAKRRAVLLESVLPTRRDRWIEILVWTAAALKEADPRTVLWRELALVARALARGDKMTTLTTMQEVARRTLSARASRRSA